jgi:hypothetical protein
LPPEYGEFMTQHQDLEFLRATRPREQPGEREQIPDDEIRQRPEQAALLDTTTGALNLATSRGRRAGTSLRTLRAGTSSRRASSASTQASIRSILRASGARPFHVLRVGDLDLPARELEPIVHEPGAVHRLDRRADRLTVSSETFAQSIEAVCIRRRSTNLDRPAVPVK